MTTFAGSIVDWGPSQTCFCHLVRMPMILIILMILMMLLMQLMLKMLVLI